MSAVGITESIVEEATLTWAQELGYAVLHGAGIAPGESHAERTNYSDVVLVDRLHSSLARINPHIPSDALEEVVRKITRSDSVLDHFIRGCSPAGKAIDGGDRRPATDRRVRDANGLLVQSRRIYALSRRGVGLRGAGGGGSDDAGDSALHDVDAHDHEQRCRRCSAGLASDLSGNARQLRSDPPA